VVVYAVILGSGWLALMLLTAAGARRRGLAVVPALLAGLFFPITWTVWYLRDERPYARTPRG
jgi:hypothetical protein